MPSTMATFAALLKTRYSGKKPEELMFSDRPLLGMIPKDEDFAGDGTVIPIIYGASQGAAGSSLATAQANSTNLVSKKFILTAGDYYGSVSMGDKVMEAARKNIAAFVDNKTSEIDNLYETMADNLTVYLYGNSGNSIGRRASVTGNVITLTEPTQIVNFEVNMKIRASAGDGSNVADAQRAGTACTVTAVSRTDGKITVDNIANITGFVDTDFIFRDGDFRGNTSTFIFHGVQSFLWADETPPTLYSMVRSDDPQRLAGCRVPSAVITPLGIEDRLKTLGTYMTGRYKGKGAKTWFLHPDDWQALESSLANKGLRPTEDKDTQFGYESISFTAGGVRAKAYVDRWCPKGLAFALRLDNWKLHSMRGLLHPIEADGLTIVRASNSNDYEYRLVSYPSASCDAPGWSGRVAV